MSYTRPSSSVLSLLGPQPLLSCWVNPFFSIHRACSITRPPCKQQDNLFSAPVSEQACVRCLHQIIQGTCTLTVSAHLRLWYFAWQLFWYCSRDGGTAAVQVFVLTHPPLQLPAQGQLVLLSQHRLRHMLPLTHSCYNRPGRGKQTQRSPRKESKLIDPKTSEIALS
jgi:hypothetical protein